MKIVLYAGLSRTNCLAQAVFRPVCYVKKPENGQTHHRRTSEISLAIASASDKQSYLLTRHSEIYCCDLVIVFVTNIRSAGLGFHTPCTRVAVTVEVGPYGISVCVIHPGTQLFFEA
jgi:hypothetical protein